MYREARSRSNEVLLCSRRTCADRRMRFHGTSLSESSVHAKLNASRPSKSTRESIAASLCDSSPPSTYVSSAGLAQGQQHCLAHTIVIPRGAKFGLHVILMQIVSIPFAPSVLCPHSCLSPRCAVQTRLALPSVPHS